MVIFLLQFYILPIVPGDFLLQKLRILHSYFRLHEHILTDF